MLASSEIFRQGHLCCVDEDDREDEIYFLASDGYPSCPDDQPSEDGALQALSQADSEIKGRAFITQNKEDRNCLQSSADLKGGSGERGVVVSTKSSCTEARDPWNIEGVGVIAETRSTCTSVQDGRYRLLAMADGKDETCINVAKDGGEVELLRSRKAEECSNNAAGRIFPSGLVKDETAELAGGHQCLAYFAVISVSGVNSVAEADGSEKRAFIRVSDQHGHRQETPLRPLPRKGSKAKCTTWCEELQLDILPGVDSVLFELLLAHPCHADGGKSGGHRPDTAGTEIVKPNSKVFMADQYPRRANTSADHSPVTDGDGVIAADGMQWEEDLGSTDHTRAGAVALLLSEVVDAWRTLESPIFDSAGSISGHIKISARIRTGTGTAECAAGAINSSTAKKNGATVATKTARPTLKEEESTEKPATEASARPFLAASTPKCCHQHKKGHSPCNTLLRTVENGDKVSDLTPTKEALLARKVEVAPRVAIFYRGLRLPFRWFRSSTAAAMDKRLRGTLGINDTSTSSPLLYNVATGGRVYFGPGIPSGLTLLAVLEDPPALNSLSRTPFGRPSIVEEQSTYPQNGEKIEDKNYDDTAEGRQCRQGGGEKEVRRSASAGDTSAPARRTRVSLPEMVAAPELPTTNMLLAPSSNETASTTTARLSPVDDKEGAREGVARDRDCRKAVACRVIRRVLSSARRRAVSAALYRWRSQTTWLRLEEESRREHTQESQQVVDFVGRLQQEVVSLTTASHEGLLAVSIDALEKDLKSRRIDPGGAGCKRNSATDPAIGGKTTNGLDKGSVERALSSLEANIGRLSNLQKEEHRCLEKRLDEAQDIEKATSCTRLAGAPTIIAETPTVIPTTPLELRLFAFNDMSSRTSTSKKAEGGVQELRADARKGSVSKATGEHSKRLAANSEILNIRNSGEAKGWNKLLKTFLARHWKVFPFKEGVEQSHSQGSSGQEIGQTKGFLGEGCGFGGRGGLGQGSENGCDLHTVLWAIFRVFSDSPPFQCNLQPPWPATAPSETTGDDLLSSCRRGHLCIGRASREKQIGSHSHIQSQSYGQLQDGGVSLPAFLKVCRRARLILSARAAWSKEQRGDDGTLKGIYAKQKGALVIECGYRGGKGECGERLEAAASPKLLHPMVAIQVFQGALRHRAVELIRGNSRFRRAIGSSTYHRGCGVAPKLNPRIRRQPLVLRRSVSSKPRRRRRQERLASERLSFQQFCMAIESVVGLLVASGDTSSNVNTTGVDLILNRKLGGGIPTRLQRHHVANGPNAFSRVHMYPSPRALHGKEAMVLKVATSYLVRLAKELSVQELLSRDFEARETLAFLDPFVQQTLEANEEIFFEIFTYYCGKYVPDPGYVVGSTKYTRGRGSFRPGLKLCYKGGKAFARDFGITPLVTSMQQLADLWRAAYQHQDQEESNGEEKDRYGVSEEGEGDDVLVSRVLVFSGFLDLLGRCAARHANRTPGRTTKVPPSFNNSSSSELTGDKPVDNSKKKGPGLWRHHPGPAMLKMLEAMQRSGGCHMILSSSERFGGLRRNVLHRGFCHP